MNFLLTLGTWVI